MCNCIKELQTKALELKYKDAPILKAEFISIAFVMGSKSKINMVTCGQMEISVEGKKKPIKKEIVYTYCPFCGEKYPE